MACSKWEEIGLLFSSHELTAQDSEAFGLHLNECVECSNELSMYQSERSKFYNSDILGDLPSEATDKEILRVCGVYKKLPTNIGVFPFALKKSFISIAFFVIGFVAVGYIAIHIKDANRNSSMALQNSTVNNLDTKTIVQSQSVATVQKDSINPDSSIRNTELQYSKTRGNLELNGVVPVDLKTK